MNTTAGTETLPRNVAEPAIYFAEYPSEEQQKRYAFQWALATLLVTSILLVSLAVS